MLHQVIHPVIFYLLLVIGAAGVALALPRRTFTPRLLGGLIAAAAGGLIVLVMSINARQHLPNVYFYIFAAVTLGGALRVITHSRPVYAALYFILTILASAGLFVILAAEFMAFALVIVYAGAILITYLFVIMLATQAPSADELEVLADYDTASREPVAATFVGFLLLGVLTTLVFGGIGSLPAPGPPGGDRVLALLPGRVEAAISAGREVEPGARIAVIDGHPAIDPVARTAILETGQGRLVYDWPEDLTARNIDELGFSLLAGHPGAIEIAGVILLMAMLGAVVLARRQVQIAEEAKARQTARPPAGVAP